MNTYINKHNTGADRGARQLPASLNTHRMCSRTIECVLLLQNNTGADRGARQLPARPCQAPRQPKVFFFFCFFFLFSPLFSHSLCTCTATRRSAGSMFLFFFPLSFLGCVCWYSDEEICGLIMLTFSSLFFFFSCVFFMWTDTATRRSGTQYSQIFFSIFFFNSLFLVVCAGTATRRSAG